MYPEHEIKIIQHIICLNINTKCSETNVSCNNLYAFVDNVNKKVIRLYPIQLLFKDDSTQPILLGYVYSPSNSKGFTKGETKNKVVQFHLNECSPFEDYSQDSFDPYSECDGCRYGQANQLAHMELGGCMSEI